MEREKKIKTGGGGGEDTKTEIEEQMESQI